MSLPDSAVRLLERWQAPSADQDRLRTTYLEHLRAFPDAWLRTGPPEHLTASCFVLDLEARHVLLALHRKGGFWVQLGGHCEPQDDGLPNAALREAAEESGLTDLELLPGPVELHRHRLPRTFGRCAEHLDVAFVAVAARAARPVVSAESLEVAWWPLDALPRGIAPDLVQRLPGVRTAARELASRVSRQPVEGGAA